MENTTLNLPKFALNWFASTAPANLYMNEELSV